MQCRCMPCRGEAEVKEKSRVNADHPMLGIGASAGGLEAFHSFLERMPADSGLAFVLVLHLPADRKSLLSSILARWTFRCVARNQAHSS